jgi:hypothetical protein
MGMTGRRVRGIIGCGLALLWAALCFGGDRVLASGGTRYVAMDGLDTGNECLAPATPCRSISRAISVAAEGDVIVVGAGDYDGPLVVKKSLTLRGSGQTLTMVRGNGSGHILEVCGGSAAAPVRVVVEDLKIKEGSATEGGGVWSSAEELTLRRVEISGNRGRERGGGIFCQGGTVEGEMVILTGNDSPEGAGLYIGGGCAFSLHESAIFQQNQNNGAAITAGGNLALTNVSAGFNSGPALKVLPGGQVNLNHVTLGWNGLEVDGAREVQVLAGGQARLNNTLVHHPNGMNCSGSVEGLTSLGYNLSDDDTCHLTAGGDLAGVDALLAGMGFNGGNTPTFALRRDSPAVDAADPLESTPWVDQRGMARRRDGNGDGVTRADIGAFEYPSFELMLPLVARAPDF